MNKRINDKALQAPRYYAVMLIAIYCVAGILRVVRYLSAVLSSENALIGSTAEEFLRGNFPLFLLGKNHMGTYDALLSAPLIHLFGPSSYILNLWAPLFSMGIMVVMHRLLKRLVGPWGVVTGLLCMAIPPAYWLFYSGYAQTHYSLGIFLSAVLMLQTARLWENQQWRLGQAFVWGLAAGAMLYTNPQTVGVFISCVVLLLIFAWRRIRIGNLAAFTSGGLIGGLPLAYYLLTAGNTYSGQVSVFGQQYFVPHLTALFTNSLPILLGFNTPVVGGSVVPGSGMFLVYLGMLLIFSAGLLGMLIQGLRAKPGLSLLFPLIITVYLAILIPSIYGDALGEFNQAYFLSFYLVLPVCFGVVAAWLARHARPVALLLPVLIVGINTAGYINFERHEWALFRSPLKQYNSDMRNRERAELLRQAHVKTLYTTNSWLLGYYTDGDPLVAQTWKARKHMDGHRIDASLDPLYYDVDLRGSASLLGLPYQSGVVAEAMSYWGFGQPDKGQLLARDSWRASTVGQKDLGRLLNDNDLSTGYSTGPTAKTGQGFILDLGEARQLTGIALVPSRFQEVPVGLKVEASTDGLSYTTLRQTKEYWGPFYISGPHAFIRTFHSRVESYWPASPVRYLRITHVGKSGLTWSVQEVLAWGRDESGQTRPSWPDSGKQLVRLLDQAKPERIYADAWPAALLRIKLEKAPWITVTRALDDTGTPVLPEGQWPTLDPNKGSTMVVNAPNAMIAAKALERWGVVYNRRDAGRFAIFELRGQKLGDPIKPLSISSGIDPDKAASLAGNGGAWSSRGPQKQGASLQIDLGEARPVQWVELHNPKSWNDYARGLAAWISGDGQQWRKVPIKLAGPMIFSGQIPIARSGPINIYHLGKNLSARYIRLVLDTSEPKWWWSVERLILRGPASAK